MRYAQERMVDRRLSSSGPLGYASLGCAFDLRRIQRSARSRQAPRVIDVRR
ncbi:hypothetical protein Y024_5831 [Burkholderia pseudomallei TSV44]|nr:hypothetical protein Y024_5831 [Burkholderia pseudomallei TSV44]